MITLFASIVGFFSSLLPEALKILQDKSDKEHELQILKMQMKIQQSGASDKLAEINAMANIEEAKAIYQTYNIGVKWLDALNGTVRPVLAYAFFMLYGMIKYYQIKTIGFDAVINDVELLWNVEDQAIFAGIISFYFGNRSMHKLRSK
jgi:hypothetical protein